MTMNFRKRCAGREDGCWILLVAFLVVSILSKARIEGIPALLKICSNNSKSEEGLRPVYSIALECFFFFLRRT